MTNHAAFFFFTTKDARMLQEEQAFDEENYVEVPEFEEEEEDTADNVGPSTSESSFIRRSHRIAGSAGLGSFQAEVGMGSILVAGRRRSARLRQT